MVSYKIITVSTPVYLCTQGSDENCKKIECLRLLRVLFLLLKVIPCTNCMYFMAAIFSLQSLKWDNNTNFLKGANIIPMILNATFLRNVLSSHYCHMRFNDLALQ